MDNDEYTAFSGQGKKHEGPEHRSPYPTDRLSPPISLVNIAREIAKADETLAQHTEGRLKLIAGQIKALQEEAVRILEKADFDRQLHQASCSFKRLVGRVYYLYEKQDSTLLFSMLGPDDWGRTPPDKYKGAYRLEGDMSWTRVGDE